MGDDGEVIHTVTTVAILGGGVGGLSAAQELAERGFAVTVYEAHDVFGGKARSMPVPGSGTGTNEDLPAEHGFRFFPGFYWHVTDTMKRIPARGATVYDRLTTCTEILMAQADGRNEIIAPAGIPKSWDALVDGLRALRAMVLETGIPMAEFAVFVERMIVMMTSCDERRLGEFEAQSWWDFVEADTKSLAYRKFLATGMTRTLVAAKAEEMSARTGGAILCQLIFDMLQLDSRVDNVLDGPTSEVWIDPWVEHLTKCGVTFRPGCRVSGIGCDGRRITGVTVTTARGDENVDADFYIAALPVEKFRLLVSPAMRAADPRLQLLGKLQCDWMTGIMFYLDTDVPLEHGHAIFIDSEWALTAISQKQFWPDVDLERRGDGRVEGILSVDVSAWDVPGPVTGKVATACSKDEIRQEVWAQLVDHIDDGTLDEANVIDWFLDPAIEFPNPGAATNAEPLLINTKSSWVNRPDAVTAIPNLFLAADFVRTHTDLATMEGANEAARAAVNGILHATGSTHRRCGVRKLQEPWVLWPFRQLDRLRWKLRRPAKAPFRLDAAGELTPTGPMARACLAAARMGGKGTFLTDGGQR
ncbi:FAD-dependent oxidoreductase [Mycobacterium sp. 236(2023)]|uniref:hydroxysqualene dehydroxylase n=1 Tax=Mycobacterium sp. 236(2023) TaxID=3038163 RepID=UPI00241587A6|nr:FAD-dependent oxidoreductase [Mycobacterium sp. 236(2023)]MDG4665690.1 FAD-dependent oxidoreductase [Mycobacterium sp. 236(2023)]